MFPCLLLPQPNNTNVPAFDFKRYSSENQNKKSMYQVDCDNYLMVSDIVERLDIVTLEDDNRSKYKWRVVLHKDFKDVGLTWYHTGPNSHVEWPKQKKEWMHWDALVHNHNPQHNEPELVLSSWSFTFSDPKEHLYAKFILNGIGIAFGDVLRCYRIPTCDYAANI